MTAARKPAQVFTLAEHLYDEFVARGWHTVDAARLFNNGVSHHLNLMALNFIMLGYDKQRVPQTVMEGLSNALGVSEQFLRALEQNGVDHPDRVAHWVCPVEILSQEMRDYIL